MEGRADRGGEEQREGKVMLSYATLCFARAARAEEDDVSREEVEALALTLPHALSTAQAARVRRVVTALTLAIAISRNPRITSGPNERAVVRPATGLVALTAFIALISSALIDGWRLKRTFRKAGEA